MTVNPGTRKKSVHGAGHGPAKGAGGMGWGGPAKGKPAQKVSVEELNRLARIWRAKTPEEKLQHQARRAVQNEELIDRVYDVALSENHQAINASLAFARLNGLLIDKGELSGPGGLPISVDRPPPETRDEWIERRKREAAGGVGAAARTTD